MPKTKENGWGTSHRVQFNLVWEAKFEQAAEKDERSIPNEIERRAKRSFALERVVKQYEALLNIPKTHREIFDVDHVYDCMDRGVEVKEIG